jgi:histidinol-phosphate aminotransferase
MDKKIENIVREDIKKILPYVPGKPMEELQREYGLEMKEIIKLASNENPLGASPKAVEAIKRCADKVYRYPEGSGYYLKKKISGLMEYPEDSIILGSGSSEIISMTMTAFINPGEEVMYPTPSFLIYKILAYTIGATAVEIPLNPDFSYDLNMFLDKITPRTRVIILCNPNNPTGNIITGKQMDEFMKKVPDDIVIISDEAYREYVEDENFGTAFPYIENKNVIVARTFSKIYGLAGLRIGYGIAGSQIISFLERIRPPFNTTLTAQEAALAALDDEQHVKKSITNNTEGKRYLYPRLSELGIDCFPTQTNFILCNLKRDASEIIKKLEQRGIIIRNMTGIGPGYIRITIGTEKENSVLIDNLKEILEEKDK